VEAWDRGYKIKSLVVARKLYGKNSGILWVVLALSDTWRAVEKYLVNTC